MRVAANLDLRENGVDNARIISAMDPPHDRRRAPPLPPRTTPFSGRTRRVSALLHSSEIVTGTAADASAWCLRAPNTVKVAASSWACAGHTHAKQTSRSTRRESVVQSESAPSSELPLQRKTGASASCAMAKLRFSPPILHAMWLRPSQSAVLLASASTTACAGSTTTCARHAPQLRAFR